MSWVCRGYVVSFVSLNFFPTDNDHSGRVKSFSSDSVGGDGG